MMEGQEIVDLNLGDLDIASEDFWLDEVDSKLMKYSKKWVKVHAIECAEPQIYTTILSLVLLMSENAMLNSYGKFQTIK